MTRLEKKLSSITRRFNQLAMICVSVMMLLTTTDVIMRCFRRPIPGTYEIVSLLGVLFVSFSLAHTSMERGHIAVDFVFQRLSAGKQRILEGINTFISAVLFALVSVYSVIYAEDLRKAGEVSMTLQMPLYPFVYGIALGCGLLSLTLIIRGFGVCRNVSGGKG